MPLVIDGFSHGDRTHLNLPVVQERLLKKLISSGKKIVYINFSGSAIALNWEQDNVAAIVQAFYPGESGGAALVNALFGTVNFSGKLPVTFYKSLDDLPSFKDYSMKGRTYRYYNGVPLYPFGYGLSYTTFNYSNLNVPTTLYCGDSLKLSINITNSGKVEGDEVVQVYLAHSDSSLTVPLRSLIAFKKVHLKAGEKRRLSFTIKPELLSIIDDSYRKVILPGKIELSVGGGQSSVSSIAQNSVVNKLYFSKEIHNW